MTALITGASSGIGRDIARQLARKGVKLIISGRNRSSLEALRDEIGRERVKIITADLSDKKDCRRLYREASAYGVDILINNAGFGVFGRFTATELERELELIDVNVTAVHTLTKLFLHDFYARDKGYILNVSSIAGFMPGPMMAAYYASKSYVLRLTLAVREELRAKKSNVYIGAFCPGPVDTDFNKNAGVNFAKGGISSEQAAKCAVKGMFARKAVIIPTLPVKAGIAAARLVPETVMAGIVRQVQTIRRPEDKQ